jgi:hypothetical protein
MPPATTGTHPSSELGRVSVAAGAAPLARLRRTRKTPLPPAARSRRTTNTLQNTRVPWLDVAAGGWPPAVVPPLALVVLEVAGVPEDDDVLEDAGVLLPEGVGVSAAGAVLMGVVVGLGVGLEPVGIGGLVSGKWATDEAYTASPP